MTPTSHPDRIRTTLSCPLLFPIKSSSNPSTFFLRPLFLRLGSSVSSREPLALGLEEAPACSSSICAFRAVEEAMAPGKAEEEEEEDTPCRALVRSMACAWPSAAWDSRSCATISIRFLRLAARSASISTFLLLRLRCRGTDRLKVSSWTRTMIAYLINATLKIYFIILNNV